MADKHIFRNVKDASNNIVALYDSHHKKTIPVNAANSDYIAFQHLVSQGKALALDDGETLPEGVNDVASLVSYPVVYPKTDDGAVPSMKPSYINKKG